MIPSNLWFDDDTLLQTNNFPQNNFNYTLPKPPTVELWGGPVRVGDTVVHTADAVKKAIGLVQLNKLQSYFAIREVGDIGVEVGCDDFITALGRVLMSSKIRTTRHVLMQVFHQIDADSNGSVDWSELTTFMASSDPHFSAAPRLHIRLRRIGGVSDRSHVRDSEEEDSDSDADDGDASSFAFTAPRASAEALGFNPATTSTALLAAASKHRSRTMHKEQPLAQALLDGAARSALPPRQAHVECALWIPQLNQWATGGRDGALTVYDADMTCVVARVPLDVHVREQARATGVSHGLFGERANSSTSAHGRHVGGDASGAAPGGQQLEASRVAIASGKSTRPVSPRLHTDAGAAGRSSVWVLCLEYLPLSRKIVALTSDGALQFVSVDEGYTITDRARSLCGVTVFGATPRCVKVVVGSSDGSVGNNNTIRSVASSLQRATLAGDAAAAAEGEDVSGPARSEDERIEWLIVGDDNGCLYTFALAAGWRILDPACAAQWRAQRSSRQRAKGADVPAAEPARTEAAGAQADVSYTAGDAGFTGPTGPLGTVWWHNVTRAACRVHFPRVRLPANAPRPRKPVDLKPSAGSVRNRYRSVGGALDAGASFAYLWSGAGGAAYASYAASGAHTGGSARVGSARSHRQQNALHGFMSRADEELHRLVAFSSAAVTHIEYDPLVGTLLTSSMDGTVKHVDFAKLSRDEPVPPASTITLDAGERVSLYDHTHADHVVSSGPVFVEPACVRRVFAAHSNGVRTLALSAQAKLVASAATDGSILIWDCTNHQLVHAVDDSLCTPRWLFLSRDGSLLVALGVDKSVKVWTISTDVVCVYTGGATKATFGMGSGGGGGFMSGHGRGGVRVTAAAFDAQRNRLCMGQKHMVVCALETNTPQTRDVSAAAARARSTDTAAKRSAAHPASTAQATTTRSTVAAHPALTDHSLAARAIAAFTEPLGRLLAGRGGIAALLGANADASTPSPAESDARDKELSLWTLRAGPHPLSVVILNTYFGQVLAADTAGCVRAMDIATGRLLCSFDTGMSVTALCLDDNERRVIVGGADGSVAMFNAANGQFLARFVDPSQSTQSARGASSSLFQTSIDSCEVTGLVYMASSKAAAGPGAVLVTSVRTPLRAWALAAGEDVQRHCRKLAHTHYSGSVGQAVVIPRTSSTPGGVPINSAAAFALTSRLSGHSDDILSVTACGELAATTGGDGVLCLWKLDSAHTHARVPPWPRHAFELFMPAHTRSLSCAAYIRALDAVVTAGADGVLRVVSCNQGALLFEKHVGAVRGASVNFHLTQVPDGSNAQEAPVGTVVEGDEEYNGSFYQVRGTVHPSSEQVTCLSVHEGPLALRATAMMQLLTPLAAPAQGTATTGRRVSRRARQAEAMGEDVVVRVRAVNGVPVSEAGAVDLRALKLGANAQAADIIARALPALNVRAPGAAEALAQQYGYSEEAAAHRASLPFLYAYPPPKYDFHCLRRETPPANISRSGHGTLGADWGADSAAAPRFTEAPLPAEWTQPSVLLVGDSGGWVSVWDLGRLDAAYCEQYHTWVRGVTERSLAQGTATAPITVSVAAQHERAYSAGTADDMRPPMHSRSSSSSASTSTSTSTSSSAYLHPDTDTSSATPTLSSAVSFSSPALASPPPPPTFASPAGAKALGLVLGAASPDALTIPAAAAAALNNNLSALAHTRTTPTCGFSSIAGCDGTCAQPVPSRDYACAAAYPSGRLYPLPFAHLHGRPLLRPAPRGEGPVPAVYPHAADPVLPLCYPPFPWLLPLVRRFRAHLGPVVRAEWLPSLRAILTASSDGDCALWSPEGVRIGTYGCFSRDSKPTQPPSAASATVPATPLSAPVSLSVPVTARPAPTSTPADPLALPPSPEVPHGQPHVSYRRQGSHAAPLDAERPSSTATSPTSGASTGAGRRSVLFAPEVDAEGLQSLSAARGSKGGDPSTTMKAFASQMEAALGLSGGDAHGSRGGFDAYDPRTWEGGSAATVPPAADCEWRGFARAWAIVEGCAHADAAEDAEASDTTSGRATSSVAAAGAIQGGSGANASARTTAEELPASGAAEPAATEVKPAASRPDTSAGGADAVVEQRTTYSLRGGDPSAQRDTRISDAATNSPLSRLASRSSARAGVKEDTQPRLLSRGEDMKGVSTVRPYDSNQKMTVQEQIDSYLASKGKQAVPIASHVPLRQSKLKPKAEGLRLMDMETVPEFDEFTHNIVRER